MQCACDGVFVQRHDSDLIMFLKNIEMSLIFYFILLNWLNEFV